MRGGIAQRHQIEGWGFSLFLHGLLLSAILPVFRQLPAPIHPEPFRWNVTFVESPQQTTAIEPATDASFANTVVQTGEADERSQTPPIQDLSPPVSQPMHEMTERLRASDDVRPVMPTPPPTAFPQAQSETSSPPSSTVEPTPIVQDTLPVQRDTAERPETIAAATPVSTEPPAPVAAPAAQEIPPPPAPSAADVAMVPAYSRDPSPVPPASAPPSTSGEPSESRADYSWLRQAVSRRLEELKRASRPSLEDAGRLKVLVKAVVSSEGKLMEAEVVKSSGVARIDQEAMTLVQRAFPMPLDFTIDRPQIVMRIPITYSRD